MKVVRAEIRGWTASYRVPFLAVIQPTLQIPPPSTLYGILSAIAGHPIGPEDTAVGFVAPYQAKAQDIERTYQIGEEGKIEKISIVKKEFLYEPELFLYVTNLDLQAYLQSPRYPILLGRSCDLAFLAETKEIELDPVEEVEFQYAILPYPWSGISAPIMALPLAFTDTVPRRAIGVQPYYLIDGKKVKVRKEGGKQLFIDPEKQWGVYFHGHLR